MFMKLMFNIIAISISIENVQLIYKIDRTWIILLDK